MKKRVFNFIVVVIILFMILYFYSIRVGTHGIRVNEILLESDNINRFSNLKIVQISDIYYGNTFTLDDMIELKDNIKTINPDVILFTGNLFYSNEMDDELLKNITDIINELNPKYGMYSISGKKDIDNNLYKKFINGCHIKNIDNNYEIIYNYDDEKLIIAGITSDNKLAMELSSKIDEETTNYKILITSNPENIDVINYHNFDLILAGSTLGGYINIPGIKNLFIDNKYTNSYYLLNNSNLYISNGLGNEEFPFRLFNRPSINFFRLIKTR